MVPLKFFFFFKFIQIKEIKPNKGILMVTKVSKSRSYAYWLGFILFLTGKGSGMGMRLGINNTGTIRLKGFL